MNLYHIVEYIFTCFYALVLAAIFIWVANEIWQMLLSPHKAQTTPLEAEIQQLKMEASKLIYVEAHFVRRDWVHEAEHASRFGRESILTQILSESALNRYNYWLGETIPYSELQRLFPWRLHNLEKAALEFKRGLASNHTCPGDILIKLFDDSDLGMVVLRNSNCPADILINMANSKHAGMRYSVARHHACLPHICAILINDPDWDVRCAALRNPNCPKVIAIQSPKEVEQLKVEWLQLIKGWAPPEKLYSLVVCKTKEEIDNLIIEHRHWAAAFLPIPELKKLAPFLFYSFYYELRYDFIANRTCPPELLIEMAKSPHYKYRLTVARNPSTPAEMLALLANDEDWGVRHAVARNQGTPAEILVTLGHEKRWLVRLAVANNPSTPAEMLALLANDEDWGVRLGVARNPSTPAEVLALLLNDENEEVRKAVADNPNTNPK